MKGKIEGIHSDLSGRHVQTCRPRTSWARVWLLIFMIGYGSAVFAQTRTIRGTVVNQDNEPIIGAVVVATERITEYTSTVADGTFSLNVSNNVESLTVSYYGMVEQEVSIVGINNVVVSMLPDLQQIEAVVKVGYGEQAKKSVVGAISQTSGEVLQRAAGLMDIGAALTGNLPGVITMQGSGQPGLDSPEITIRAASTWNNSTPLVLVDGIERSLNTIDVASVDNMSVLKDASATAVYGVKGANGVILVTTRRGQEGRARINVGFTATMKQVSKLPGKLDAYDAMMMRNIAIERELGLELQESWPEILPQSFIDNYRYNQSTVEMRERYANTDWQKALFRNTAMSYNANLNISGGTSFVQYFVAAEFASDGDLFRRYDNGRSYTTDYSYNRLNVRANLDFNITKTTRFSMTLAASNGIRKYPWEQNQDEWQLQQNWSGAYSIAPDAIIPQYADGAWGNYPADSNVTNSVQRRVTGGAETSVNTNINTDFVLEQKLDFITKGLSARGSISWDNVFSENRRGVNDLYNNAQTKWINPWTGTATLTPATIGNSNFDYARGMDWGTQGGSVNNGATSRKVVYEVRLNWRREFGRHRVAAMGVFNRQQAATGGMIPRYREDWAFRATYDFASRYQLEYNGAYNGSEKFDRKYRFGFFNSGAIGWVVSEEAFMKSLRWLELLKFRFSYGEIGDDSAGGRWLYQSAASHGGTYTPYQGAGNAPFLMWNESLLGNPDVRWETVTKTNFGIDFAFLRMFEGAVEIFKDRRRDILITGDRRAVPSYLGIAPPTANLGKMETKGYELELKFNKPFANGLRVWANMNMTHSENMVIERDDQAMRPDYQKQAGFSTGQHRSHITAGFINTWDQIYASTKHETNDLQKLPGDYITIDFNNDGIIDSKDSVPWGFTNMPQNTFNATFGFEWKGWSAFLQFYGTTNVTRDVPLTSLGGRRNVAFGWGTWWSKDDPNNANLTVPGWAQTASFKNGTQSLFDASYIRLKNAEIAYTFTQGWVKKLGIGDLKVYLNGNNLWLWTRMPDDRESNIGGSGGGGAYPTVRRFNLGVRFNL